MSDNIKVVVKARPLIPRELEDKLSFQWRVKNNTLYQLDQKDGRDFGQAFTFDKVYDQDTKTTDVYNDVAKPIVEAATAGFNGTIFAYGQTSSGKTYTMTGTESSPGIIPLAVLNLFEIIKNVPDRDFLVRVSYIEIYNETLKDLLNLEKENIKIHESLQGIKVDVTEKVTTTPEEVLDIMKKGEVNRQTGSTNMNEASSRSHSIFQITIESREHIEGEEQAGCVNVSQLNLVDLAGSERAGQTGATGLRFKEGTHINKSLSALALVIKQLSEGPNKYANYRDSKLTRILQNSLGGNAKTSIICAVTLAAVEETISTLQFANRAKSIKNKPEVNAVATDATMIQSLTKQLSKLQSELETKKNLEVMLESKKNVEQHNYNLQKQIAALQKLIINGFAQRRSTDFMDGARRKLQQQRRVTISTLHSIENDSAPSVVKFRTPILKYNPMSIPNQTDFVPIQNSSKLETLPEETTSRLITPPPNERMVNFSDEIIKIADSDDDDDSSIAPTCSPYHKCYDSSKTPPCILRKNAKQAEKNLQDIVELTEREKIYSPSVIELIQKIENHTSEIVSLQEEVDNLNKQGKAKDFEMDQLKNKIKKSEEEVQRINTVKMELETQCNTFNTKLTDWEVSYETLKKKAKLREEELLSMLDEKNNKYRNPENICKTLSRTIDKELTQFMDMSKDISLVNSDNECSMAANPDDEPLALIQNLVSDLNKELHIKNQNLVEFEANLYDHKQKISSMENAATELQEVVSKLQAKLEVVESENSLLKSFVDHLNSTISNQKINLETANSNIESYNNVIQELQIQLNVKENNLNINVNDNYLESMIANEESIIANNENIKNIMHAFKSALDARNKEINQLKSALQYDTVSTTDSSLKEQVDTKTKQVNSLNEEVQVLKQQLSDNIATIDKLLIDKNNLKDVVRELTIKFTDLEKNNEERNIALENLKENHGKLLVTFEDKDLKEQELIILNENLMKNVEEMNNKINNLEKQIKHKEDVIETLKKEDEITQNNLDEAKSLIIKLQEILAILTNEIQEVPAIIDSFVYSTLNDSLNTLETKVIKVVAEKDEAVKVSIELRNELTATMNKYNTESSLLHLKINNLNETANKFCEQNEILTKQLKEMTSQLEQTRYEYSEKVEELDSLKRDANKNHEDLLAKDNLIALLNNNECTLRSEIETLARIGDQKSENFLKEIENLSISNQSKDKAYNEALSEKDQVITNLKLSLSDTETELREKHKDLEIEFQKIMEFSKGRDKLMSNILEKVTQITGDFHIENNLSCNFENINVNVYEQILLTLEKIVNHITLIDSGCGDTESNLETVLLDAKKEIRELTDQNLKLMTLLSEIEHKNHVMSLEIEKIEHENKSFKESLFECHGLLEQLKIELKAKAQEIDSIEMKARDWKEQFMSLDLMMKQRIEELQSENDQLKTKYLKLQMDRNHHDDPTIEKFSDFEYCQEKADRKSIFKVDKTIVSVSPPSLLTICCNKIIDTIQPSETDSKSETPSSSNANMEKQSVESQGYICQCNHLSSELRTVKDENIRLLKASADLEHENQQLLHEQDEVRQELQLLVASAMEFYKKLSHHKTNLSILTATTYAENRSLKSQVKGLQHHHSRYHNVCQKDIPAFKKQLYELMAILKREQAFTNIDNFKLYSLPDVLDNNTTCSNFKNESTLDGDLLMLDTNVTVTTLADTTLMGHEQTCLDLTLYNEASCQTNECNQTIDPNIVSSQVEVLNSNYHNMLERLNILKEENDKLRAQMYENSNVNEHKIDAVCSQIKTNNSFSENSQDNKLNAQVINDFICDKCSNLDDLQLKHNNLTEELNTLSQKLLDERAQKADIEEKYKNIMLELPSTDALVTKLNVLETDYSKIIHENDKLTSTLHNKTKEIKRLQEENDTLSTQVMDNISEAESLNKELIRLKEVNNELTGKCNNLEDFVKESHIENKINISISCPECAIKDDLINSLKTKNSPESHTKLNRSFSDSETSSRHNMICTLQNELDAGRADCKEITEEVATIKNQLERSNLSMDLDDSMGDSNIFGCKSFDVANSQYNKCNMPDIPEEVPVDMYMVDKIDCINYYVDKTGTEKENINTNVKIVDILKMLHNNLLTKHANEVENFVNRLRDFEESKNLLQLQINNVTSEYNKTKDDLEAKDEYLSKIANVLSQIKSNTNIVNKEILNITAIDKTTKIVSSFKINLLKILDREFGLSCSHIFDSLIGSVLNNHQNDLIKITDQYTTLQEQMKNVTTELNSVNDSLTQLKSQLSCKENEYNLLKSQKERVHEISKAVTLDIVKKEQVLSEAISKGCQKLLELNIINPGDIDLTCPLNKNISLLFEHLINQHTNRSNSELEKETELLALEVRNSKTIIDEKQKQLDDIKIRNEKMQEINRNITLDLVDKEKKLQTLKTLHEDLNQIYESKIEENKANLNLIENLTQEINILKESLANKEANVQSLQSKIEAQIHERTSEKDVKISELLNTVKTLQETVEYLKGVNEMIIKEKEICASELESSSETIKRNKMDLEKMTSDILILRESVKENTTVIENLKLEAKSFLKQNMALKQQIEIKCRDCLRLETNIKTHEKTAEIQSKMIMRLQKQKEQDDKSKNKHLEELTEKWMQLQNECDILQNNVKTLNTENDELKLTKQSLEARVSELEAEMQSGHKPRTSIDAIAETSRRRRQSLHDSKRLFAEDKLDFEDNNDIDAVFESRTKPDDLFMEVDDNNSDRSIRISRGRDSLLSRTDQSDKDEEHPSRPSSVQATRRRRQSTHDLHRSVLRHTPSPHDSRLLEELNQLKPESGNGTDNSALSQLKQQLSSCQQELEDLKEKYRELDEECETCSEYLRERDEQCKRLKKDKAALENTVKELKENLLSSNPNTSQHGDRRRSVAHVSVNTDEDWANLHSVVVDRMSYDAEVEKNKRLTKTIEELRFKNQELKNTISKMQKALEKNTGRYNNRELEATKLELQSCKEELADLRQRYKELDEECETCSEYLRERDEQCRRLKEAKLALEAKLEEMQEDDSVGNILQSVRNKRRSTHDQNRTLAVELTDATTETSDDFLSYQVERDNSSQLIAPEAQTKEIKRLKMTVDKLSQQKAALENQLITMSSAPAPAPVYVATGSAIVQNQQLTDVMKENQKLKKVNAKLIKICQKRGKDSNQENVDPS